MAAAADLLFDSSVPSQWATHPGRHGGRFQAAVQFHGTHTLHIRAADTQGKTSEQECFMTAGATSTTAIITLADLLEQLGDIAPARVRFRPAPGTATERVP
jgi:hypothetical protein